MIVVLCITSFYVDTGFSFKSIREVEMLTRVPLPALSGEEFSIG